jgi:hypothetical protein
MLPVYNPSDLDIGIGIPGTPLYVELRDWVSLVADRPNARFTLSKGIWNEPFVDMSGDSSRTFTLTILQSSIDIQNLHNLFLAQLTGLVGVPFSIIDNGKDSSITQLRQKSIYPVGIILDERQESFGLEATAWVYRIGMPSGTTLFF